MLTGSEAEADALGATARELEADGHRTVVFVGDVTTAAGRAALRELLAELFHPPDAAPPSVLAPLTRTVT